jgi:hypothetical protein
VSTPHWITSDRSDLGRAGKRAALTAMQGGLCAICARDGYLVADHDHDTGLLVSDQTGEASASRLLRRSLGCVSWMPPR